jgi:hypothetical protein
MDLNDNTVKSENYATRLINLIGAGLRAVGRFYIDGFREMTVGRQLWALIIVKLAVLLLVFKLLFFPDTLSRDYPDDEARAKAVRTSLTTRR